MDQTEGWAQRVAAGIGERIALYRDRQKLSAQQLADRCSELGMPSITRVVITKLENGRRDAVSTAELAVLAAALGVPPVLLLFPLGLLQSAEVLPSLNVHPWDGIRWFTGEITGGIYGDQVDGPESPISLYSLHYHLVSQWASDQAAADAAMKAVMQAPTEEARREAEEDSAIRREMAEAGYLRTLRATMRRLGYLPPDLPPEIAAAFGEDA